MTNIVILTGAGISAESGLGTFRDEGGLWAQHRIEDVATPGAFERTPDLVHAFYNTRRAQAAEAGPNAAHLALAKLEQHHSGSFLLITQNVDGLHEKAGSRKIIHMHGQLDRALCHVCGYRWDAPTVMQTGDPCPKCAAQATRPDIVWFGEMPYQMDFIYEHLANADLFVSIGTSGEVYPAANFVAEAKHAGAHTLELNLEPSSRASAFAEVRVGKASQMVPEWVAEHTL